MTNNPDYAFLSEAVPQLHEYLLSNELFWPLSGSLPRLTLGSLALAMIRLRVVNETETLKFDGQIEAIHTKWKMAWEKKAAREVANRMRLWSQFLTVRIHDSGQSSDVYRTEVRGRVILELLAMQLPDLSEWVTLLDLDATLKGHLVPGPFIWEPEVEPAFARDIFWYLYGSF